jgi:hypothetical protein
LLIFSRLTEVGGQQQLEGAVLQLEITLAQGVLPGGAEFGDQDRLVDLYPLDADLCKSIQEFSIDRQQMLQQCKSITAVLALA